MKAPDKIFLPGDIDWPSAAILTLGKQPGDVEYIRKDALMEMLLTMEARHSVFYLKGKIVREIIDKISSL